MEIGIEDTGFIEGADVAEGWGGLTDPAREIVRIG